jgi:hypothetical protein
MRPLVSGGRSVEAGQQWRRAVYHGQMGITRGRIDRFGRLSGGGGKKSGGIGVGWRGSLSCFVLASQRRTATSQTKGEREERVRGEWNFEVKRKRATNDSRAVRTGSSDFGCTGEGWVACAFSERGSGESEGDKRGVDQGREMGLASFLQPRFSSMGRGVSGRSDQKVRGGVDMLTTRWNAKSP